MPSVFARLGMVSGVIMTVGLGFVSIYNGYRVGQVKLKYPRIENYAEAVRLIWGQFGYHLTSVMFVLLLVCTTGSHALTGSIAFVYIFDIQRVCTLVWSAISAVILFLLALPPSFHEFAILGYIDFFSIITAVMITVIATGIDSQHSSATTATSSWSLWPQENLSFADYFNSATNIVFAYSFTVCQFSFMAEMHTPSDYKKSILTLGIIEIVIYTATGALVYAFVGADVSSPAILSTSKLISRVAFGFALPVIFISGSICTTVTARYLMNRVFENSPTRYINDSRGWAVWISLLMGLTLIAWIIAEAIPVFNDLLSIMASLFVSGFSFYFPALFWFYLLKEGSWYKGLKNRCLSMINGSMIVIGVLLLVCGTYGSVENIISTYQSGGARAPFTCSSNAYT